MTSKNPLIFIHLVTHNDEKSIFFCLKSLQKQTFKDFKVLIIDNNSCDKTLKIIEKFNFPIIRNTENIGYPAAQNEALKNTKSRFVLTLNADVILEKNFLYYLVKNFNYQSEKIGMASGKILRIDFVGQKPTKIDDCGLFMRKNRTQGLVYENELVSFPSSKKILIFGPDGAAAFYKKELLEDIKINGEYFDNDFFMFKDDIDVAWRAQLRDWQGVFIPQAIAYHIRTFRPKQRKKVSTTFKWVSVRNRYYLMIKNDNFFYFLKDFFRILTYDFGILGYILLFEQKSLVAYFSLLINFKKMLKKRQMIQEKIKASPKTVRKWFW